MALIKRKTTLSLATFLEGGLDAMTHELPIGFVDERRHREHQPVFDDHRSPRSAGRSSSVLRAGGLFFCAFLCQVFARSKRNPLSMLGVRQSSP